MMEAGMLRRVVFVSAALAAATPAPVLATTALEMVSKCSESFALPVIQGDDIRMQSTLETGMCWGAFEVLLRVLYFINPDKTPLLHICPPAGVRQTQLIKIFLGYAS